MYIYYLYQEHKEDKHRIRERLTIDANEAKEWIKHPNLLNFDNKSEEFVL